MNARRYDGHDVKEELFYRMAVVVRATDVARGGRITPYTLCQFIEDILTVPFQLLLNRLEDTPQFAPSPEQVAELKARIG